MKHSFNRFSVLALCALSILAGCSNVNASSAASSSAAAAPSAQSSSNVSASSEEQKEIVRDMVQTMRKRREEKNK